MSHKKLTTDELKAKILKAQAKLVGTRTTIYDGEIKYTIISPCPKYPVNDWIS
ncbi:MAG: hypothetical protein M3Q24_01265 [bacterium]|nr:hypothetical protein [bacterium]